MQLRETFISSDNKSSIVIKALRYFRKLLVHDNAILSLLVADSALGRRVWVNLTICSWGRASSLVRVVPTGKFLALRAAATPGPVPPFPLWAFRPLFATSGSESPLKSRRLNTQSLPLMAQGGNVTSPQATLLLLYNSGRAAGSCQ